jgi:WD40 repeat protein
VLKIENAHTGLYIYSACLLFDEIANKNYVISAAPNEYTKVWDFNGKFVRDFGVTNESTYFINEYFDKTNKQYYVLNANSTDIKVYDFKTGLLYRSFKASPQTWHMSALVNEVNGVTQLIESDGTGNIRVWNFHTGEQIMYISTPSINLRGICLWNDQYLFGASSDYNVKLYDLKAGTMVQNFTSHTSTVCALDKIVHPKLGECLISHGLDGKLKIWALNK